MKRGRDDEDNKGKDMNIYKKKFKFSWATSNHNPERYTIRIKQPTNQTYLSNGFC